MSENDYYCSYCGQLVLLGTFHYCSNFMYNCYYYQYQKLEELLKKLQELIDKLEKI
jgi:hypothetical protein